MLAFLYSIIDYFSNITILYSNNNIFNIACISILKNINKKNIVYYTFIPKNNFFIYKYIYILIGFFFKLNIKFIDCLPNNLNDFLFLIYFFNSNIKLEIIENSNNLQKTIFLTYLYKDLFFYNSLLLLDENNLNSDQLYFFLKIKEYSIVNNNKLIESISFIKGFNIYFNEKNFNDYNLWNLSFDGKIGIDLLMKDGKKNINCKYLKKKCL